MTRRSNRSPVLTGVGLLLIAFFVAALPAGAQQRAPKPVTPIKKPTRSAQLSGTGLKVPSERIFYPVGVRVSRGYSAAMAKPPGEVQSTVVPPNKSAACPKGRLIISNDREKTPGGIRGRDLDSLDGLGTWATFDPLPDPKQRILSNDHDVVTLNNGDILYLRMGQARTSLSPKPIWFDHTYKLKDNWGPGARSVIFVWRSEDCGETFSLRSSIDTAELDDGWGSPDDGSGGMPQRPASQDPPGSVSQPIWQMGGTDGSLAKVDRATNRIFYTMGVVGRVPYRLEVGIPGLPPVSSAFMLTTERIGRSMVVMSSDRGDTWQAATTLGFPGWRTEVVPMANDQLAFAAFASDGVVGSSFIHYTNVGSFPAANQDSEIFSAPETQGKWGWSELPWEHSLLYKKNEDKEATDRMQTNVPGQTILTRSPSSKGLLLAFMDTLEGGAGDGYRLYLVDGSGWTPMAPIAPAVSDPDNFILHPTAVDFGVGPVLFYWYDVDSAAQSVTIRGRFITRDDLYTFDFKISDSFSVATSKWYGDYHTAGGFEVQPRLSFSHRNPMKVEGAKDDGETRLSEARESQVRRGARRRYEYYPVWVQPGNKVHFARIEYTPPETLAENAESGHFRLASRDTIRMQRQTLDTSKLTFEQVEEIE